jgi:hypothetical protein
MRLLIGNVIDEAIRRGGDTSGYVQRVFWLAEEGDAVIVPAPPDRAFLDHVTEITGRRHEAMHIEVVGESQADAAAAIGRHAAVTEVLPLWPSRAAARLARAMGLAHQLPGCHFLAQGGGELVNSKANFRSLAAAAGAPTAHGGVCYTPAEGVTAVREIIDRGRAAVVKQAHNGSGNGNEIVSADRLATAHVGARHSHTLAGRPDAIERYWRDRWAWASADGRFPVVVEELLPDCRSVYAEYHVSDAAVEATGSGVLHYADRVLSRQTVPIPPGVMSPKSHETLVALGLRLARLYRDIGYRGYLSADALVDDSGDIAFTEVNAQVSGSVHLYRSIAADVVDCAAEPRRSVSEFEAPAHWRPGGVKEFLRVVREAGLRYDPTNRTGVIVTVPPPVFDPTNDEFSFCVTYDAESTLDETMTRLGAAFNGPRPEVPAASR